MQRAARAKQHDVYHTSFPVKCSIALETYPDGHQWLKKTNQQMLDSLQLNVQTGIFYLLQIT